MALSPDGKSLALLTASGVRVYDFETLEPLWEDLSSYARYYDYWLSWAPDGAHLAAQMASGVLIWNAETGERTWEITPDGEIGQVAWVSRDQLLIYAFDTDANIGQINVWNILTEQQVYESSSPFEDESQPSVVLISPNGRQFVVREYRYVTIDEFEPRSVFHFFDATSGEFLYTLEADKPGFDILTFSGDSTLLATVVWNEAEFRADVQIFDAASGRLLYTLIGEESDSGDRAAFSPDNRWLVTGKQGSLLIWSVEEEQRITALEGHDRYAHGYAFAWSPDSTRLSTGASDENIVIWDTQSWEAIHTLTGHNSEIRELAFSTDGSILVSHSAGQVIAWDTETGTAMLEIRGIQAALAAALAERGERLTWDMRTRKIDQSLASIYVTGGWTLQFNPDGTRLAALDSGGTLVVFNWDTGEEIVRKGSAAAQIRSIDWSPDGSVLAVGGERGSVELLNAQTGERVGAFAPPDESGFRQFIGAGVAFSPDGNQIAVSSEAVGDVISGVTYIRDLQTSDVLHLWIDRATGEVQWSGNGRFLIVRGYSESVVWDVAKDEEIRRLRPDDSSSNWALWSPQGAVLAVRPSSHSILVWNPDTALEVQLEPAVSFGWSHDGRLAASADGQVVTVYNTQTWEAILTFATPGEYVSQIRFSSDRNRLIVSGSNGMLTLWQLKP